MTPKSKSAPQYSASLSTVADHQYVFLSKHDPEPIKASHSIMMDPVAAAKAKKTMPGQPFTLNAIKSEAYPAAIDAMERGEYFAQMLFDGNYGGRAAIRNVGNFYSPEQLDRFAAALTQALRAK